MLNPEIRIEIEKLLKSTKRKGIKKLIDDLERLGYYDAPASTMFHLNGVGGLAEHSLNVCKTALALAKTLKAYEQEGITKDSIIISTLLHDLAKSSYNGKPEYIPNILKSGIISDKKPWERNKQRPKVDHSILGAQMLAKYIDLTDDELVAIIYHDGGYSQHFREMSGGEVPLWLLIHFSDMWNARFIETIGGDISGEVNL